MKKSLYPLCIISGSTGKKIVVKQYSKGTVITKYPDMEGIVASGSQHACRNLFKEAVAFAQEINNDAEKKKAFRKKNKSGKRVYHAAIREYMLKAKEAKEIKAG